MPPPSHHPSPRPYLRSQPQRADRAPWLPLVLASLALAWLPACREDSPPSSPSPPPSVRSGQEIFQSCLLCHSTREMQRGPLLNGLPAWYTEEQLRKFQAGWRGQNPTNRSEWLMGTAIGQIQSPAERRQVARHIESLPPARHLLTVPGDPGRGEQLYQTGCASCHGAKGEGNREFRGSPLTPLEDWYHLDQLRKYKLHLRGYHPRDIDGQIMAAAVQMFSDEQFRDMVRYVSEVLAEPLQ